MIRSHKLISTYNQRSSLRGIAQFNHFGGNNINIVNASNGKVMKENVPVDSEIDVKTKYIKARSAQQKWANEPLSRRKEVIARFNTLLKEEQERVATLLSNEMGKPISQANNEVNGSGGRIQFFLDNVESTIQPSVRRSANNLSEELRYEPLGVIANVSAWNYPIFVGVNVFVPALLTGNSVLYKPSEHVLLLGQLFGELLQKSGLPQDVFNVIVGGGETARHLLNQPVDGVFFTGSNATGEKIAKQMAGRMVPVQLELGGKDPTYVTEDADVVKAAKSLADGAMYNTGQSCCSVERIYVHAAAYDQFVNEFVNEVKTFKIGDPSQKDTYIGPLTLRSQPSFLEAQVADAVAKGAKVLLGGKKGPSPGYFEPTVLVNVNHTMDVMKYESFGPIIGIQKVNSDSEAIQLMNDCIYGLTSGVYSKSKQRAEAILSKIESGTVYWNACDRVTPHLPWIGRKGSGIGNTLGKEGILAFVRPKSWHIISP